MAKPTYRNFLSQHDKLSHGVIKLGRYLAFDPTDAEAAKVVTARLRYVCEMGGYLKAISPPLVGRAQNLLPKWIESMRKAEDLARSALDGRDTGVGLSALARSVDVCHRVSEKIHSLLPEDVQRIIPVPPDPPKFSGAALQAKGVRAPRGTRPVPGVGGPGGDDQGEWRGPPPSAGRPDGNDPGKWEG